ncbi:HNH endonuclease signature motif containing protein [Pseudophaeobacter sp. EL27]|uniref:HNH endonuclease signature motif containing protein n=1 Tax=Pseudophaeobacter sp. EL27 TaxID=2107580 RepID=UPI000EFBAD04|nr:HNH endonuclease signature motif containing protein [Pseudophaeobacter sp. EL27]
MKLSVSFPALAAQRQRMNAPVSKWELKAESLSPRELILAELETGIVIELDDLETSTGGLLSYKGEQVLLYIKDTGSSQWVLENEPEKSRKFHVAECSTLESMRQKGRFERYVVISGNDGVFPVDWKDPDTGERGETKAELKVCKNCLKALDWLGYENPGNREAYEQGQKMTKRDIFQTFDISDFFLSYSTYFHQKPSRKASEAELNTYVPQWAEISHRKRAQSKWRCEKCNVDLKHASWALHCHHRNGVVTDNRASNLEILCAMCHADQPNHGHMKVNARTKSIIFQARA